MYFGVFAFVVVVVVVFAVVAVVVVVVVVDDDDIDDDDEDRTWNNCMNNFANRFIVTTLAMLIRRSTYMRVYHWGVMM